MLAIEVRGGFPVDIEWNKETDYAAAIYEVRGTTCAELAVLVDGDERYSLTRYRYNAAGHVTSTSFFGSLVKAHASALAHARKAARRAFKEQEEQDQIVREAVARVREAQRDLAAFFEDRVIPEGE